MLSRFHKDRRRAQAGTTLVELLVSITIMGLALVLVVGTISTGLLNAALAKRNTAAQAVVQYELDKIGGSPFQKSPQGYSECFATENAAAPTPVPTSAPCLSSYSLRADVTVSATPDAPTSQKWTVTVVSLVDGAQVGSAVSLVKVNH
jgi:type II secretory pathway pseudopilin PulG